MESIVGRIQKLLALGERGGTEAEAEVAMQKVHELLAKHNLSLDDVKGEQEQEEDYIRDYADASVRQPWQTYVWAAVSHLYFCQHFQSKALSGRKIISTRHMIVGKPSNIAVVKYIATYLIRTGVSLAKDAARYSDSRQSFSSSFKKGFAYRINERVREEIKKAREGRMTDSITGTALMVSPLYDQTKRDIDRFMMEQSIRPKTAKGSMEINNRDGYVAGREAADSVSLVSNGVGHKAALQIGCK